MPLTPEELRVINLLADAWNAFVDLPVQHPSHRREMEGFVHSAQRLVMSRPTSRDMGWVKTLYPKEDQYDES